MSAPPDFTCPNGHRIPEQRFDPAIGCVVVGCTYRKPSTAADQEYLPEAEDAASPDEATVRAAVSSAATRIRGYVGRIEGLIGERDDINAQIRREKADAKQDGLNVKALNELIRRRAMDPDVRRQMDDDVAVYEAVVGLSFGVIDGGELAALALPAPAAAAAEKIGKATRARRDAMATAALAAQAREGLS